MQDWTLMDDKNGVNNGGLDNAKSFSQWSLLQRESVCGLARIQELNLAANRIRDFHVAGAGGSSTDTAEAERCRAPELKELNLSLNLLTAVPRNLSEFAPNLEILNLSYNEIESATLDATYAAMAALRYLDLSRNRIHVDACGCVQTARRFLLAVRRCPTASTISTPTTSPPWRRARGPPAAACRWKYSVTESRPSSQDRDTRTVLFFSPVLDPRVGHTMDVLSSYLCYSD